LRRKLRDRTGAVVALRMAERLFGENGKSNKVMRLLVSSA
jgi:hypothetical protein